MSTDAPDLSMESALHASGSTLIGGIDEVGRGAWAGPVSVGVVVIRDLSAPPPEGVRDSKLLSPRARERMVPLIERWAEGWAVGHATPDECDQWGMTFAVGLAGLRALATLPEMPDTVIVDGPRDLLRTAYEGSTGFVVPGKVVPIVKADRTCATVAAASILAKVTRDRMMASWAPSYPAYDFDSNAGYPSPSHQRALKGYGLTAIHRRSWSFTDDLGWIGSGRTS